MCLKVLPSSFLYFLQASARRSVPLVPFNIVSRYVKSPAHDSHSVKLSKGTEARLSDKEFKNLFNKTLAIQTQIIKLISI